MPAAAAPRQHASVHPEIIRHPGQRDRISASNLSYRQRSRRIGKDLASKDVAFRAAGRLNC
jgi:hypothetical protein